VQQLNSALDALSTAQKNGDFAGIGQETFFPEVSLTFTVDENESHYHVPLLLSPFAFSTYRGS
jgi:5-hydroxyisourate hydrolase-like protein (transthyretin family)